MGPFLSAVGVGITVFIISELLKYLHQNVDWGRLMKSIKKLLNSLINSTEE